MEKETCEENKVIYLSLKKKGKIKAEYRGLLGQWNFSTMMVDTYYSMYLSKLTPGKKTRREF